MLAFYPSTLVEANEIEAFGNKVEKALNSKKKADLYQLFATKIADELYQKYNYFRESFPNAKWSIKHLKSKSNAKQMLLIDIKGKEQIGAYEYSLKAEKVIAVKLSDMKAIATELISEYSILKTINSDIDITIGIPNIVLTGSSYDIDIIVNKPLKDSILAGGLIAINSKDLHSNNHQEIELVPMESGGIFKKVRAPLKPGIQRWGALLAHPNGIVSITKAVKIVSKKENLILK
ncbi:hypothetical protein [Prochlorococcus marinus]|uniref:hypothetical protein n=1 Tax=Prochlorococcus marinus TaxID=1219 RepID=UPI0022B2AE4A|nr:hypothetical protein [Prochlorococcus marinus]